MSKTQCTMQALLTLTITLICLPIHAKNGITFRISGRLGDNIVTYCQHKWLAHKYNLDLYVPNFRYKEFFGLSTLEKNITAISRYRTSTILYNEAEISSSINYHLYQSSYYMNLNGVVNHDELGDYLFRKSIEDPAYGSKIRKALSLPTIKFPIKLPLDRISVAIHIRKGCGDDYPLFSKQYETDTVSLPQDKIYSDQHHCIKFPPEQFYAEQLKKLYVYLGEKPLYVYIFSDAPSPEEIVHRMQRYLENRCNIVFDTKKSDTVHPLGVLEDIYAMSIFEYLIRSGSHFPWTAQMIGNHKGIIRPIAIEWVDNYMRITRTQLDIPHRADHRLTTIEF